MDPQGLPPPPAHPLRSPLLAALGSLALAVLLTWPAALDLGGGLLGHPGNDTWNHAWGYWWVGEGLLREGRIPLSTPLLNHPYGGSLFFIDTFNAAASAPLAAAAGLPVAYNVTVILGLGLNAFGAWMLARHALRDDAWAALPAVIYGCSAHILGQAYNGITETLNAGWLPLFGLGLLRTLERPRLGRGLWMGLMLALCALSNFYYGLFGVLLGVMVVLHRAITSPRQVRWGAFFLSSAVGAVLFSALVLPVLGTLSSTVEADDAMVTRDPEFVWASLLNHNMTDVVSFFRPGRHYSPDLKALYGEDLLIVLYLGWVALGLGAAAVLLSRPRRELGLWLWLGAVFWVFSLGPYLHVAGEYVRVEGRQLPLPFLTFFEAFPLFSRISHPFRFVVPTTLALGVLAGFGARALAARLRLPGGLVLGGSVVAVLVEILLLSPAPWPLPRCEARIPAVYQQLGAEGAVLDLPITVPNLERAVYTWYQTAHGRPSPYGLNDPLPDPLERNPLTWLIIQVETSRALDLPRVLPDLELVMGARMLGLEGYRYIVVHEGLYPQHKREAVGALLQALFGEPTRAAGEGIAVYTLPGAEG